MGNYIDEAVAKIREQVGDDEVILGLSGGVDSSVAAALIHRAIGDRLTCVFVDHGLLRLDEARLVMEMFAEQPAHQGDRGRRERAFPRPARRRQPTRRPSARSSASEFVDVFTREAGKLKQAKWLAQGTIYPDVIESGGAKTKKAITIKSHHNVGGLPATLGLKLLEPLRELFKDEVRELGTALGLPHDMVYRHPFPGPGPRRAHPRRGQARVRRPAAPRRRDLHRGAARRRRSGQRQELVRADQPGVRRLPAGQERRRDGRRPHLRATSSRCARCRPATS